MINLKPKVFRSIARVNRPVARLLLVFTLSFISSSAALAFDSKEANKTFKKCVACHKIGDGAKTGVGPHLNGLANKAPASEDGFKYSKAFIKARESGLVWNKETLDAFLEKPRKYISGTKMGFAGIKKEDERANLVDWLLHFAADGSELSDKAKVESTDTALLGASAAAMAGDPEYGQYLSGECVTCHKTSGANDGIPSIVGWPKEFFIDVLYQYKLEKRENPVMRTVAKRLGDEEMAALAAYFASLKQE